MKFVRADGVPVPVESRNCERERERMNFEVTEEEKGAECGGSEGILTTTLSEMGIIGVERRQVEDTKSRQERGIAGREKKRLEISERRRRTKKIGVICVADWWDPPVIYTVDNTVDLQ